MSKKIEGLTYVLFTISNILILFNPGAFWDDWTIFNMSDKGILNQFQGNGIIVFGYIHLLLKTLSGSPLLYHLLTFILQLVSIFALFRLVDLTTSKGKTRIFLFFSILIYSIFPHYDSKITMIVFPYTLSLSLFVVATYFLFRFEKSRRLAYRILSLILFFFSFFTNSLLFFYILPLFFAFIYKDLISSRINFEIIKNLVLNVFRRIDYFLLPIFFWILRSFFFMPSQQYKAVGYNEVKFESLLEVPYRLLLFGYHFIVHLAPLVKEAFTLVELWILFFIIAATVHSVLSKVVLDMRVSFKLLLWGLSIIVAGVFPYLIVEKYPLYLEYSSRHQLLMGFGVGISVCALIFQFHSFLIKRLMLSFTIAAFVCLNVFLHFSFFKGYVKQVVFQEYFAKENFSSQTSMTVLLEDKTKDFTLKGNPIKFYAFAGMLKRKNAKENILLIDQKTLEYVHEQDIFAIIEPYSFQYNLADYKYIDPSKILEVSYSERKKPVFPILTYYFQFFSGQTEKWNDYFNFELEPILNSKTKISS